MRTIYLGVWLAFWAVCWGGLSWPDVALAQPQAPTAAPAGPPSVVETGAPSLVLDPGREEPTAAPTAEPAAATPESGGLVPTPPEPAIDPVPSDPPAAAEPQPERSRARSAPPPKASPSGAARAWVVIKVIIGLSVLVVLAFLGGHPSVLKLERTLGISQVVTAGFPFVALGLVARQDSIGVLSDSVLLELTPLLHVGLGWLGFMVGFRLDLPTLDRVPRGTALMVAIEASAPFAVIAAASGAIMVLFQGELTDEIVRDAIVLGAAGAMTAPRITRGLGERLATQRDDPDALMGSLDEIAGIVGLLFLAAFFRPLTTDVAWVLPPVGWIFVTLGAGVALGVLMYAMVQAAHSRAEFLASTLGFIAFASGIAGFLHLSPIVVCFVAGAIVGNFPTEHRRQLWDTFSSLERPIHLVFLMVVGAVWQVGDWRGWVMLVVFVAARFGGKALGLIAAKNALSDIGELREEHRVIVTPLSMLAVAIVISVDSLYPSSGESIPWIVTAVLGGAVISEVAVAALAPPQMTHVPVAQAQTPAAALLRGATPAAHDIDAPLRAFDVEAPPGTRAVEQSHGVVERAPPPEPRAGDGSGTEVEAAQQSAAGVVDAPASDGRVAEQEAAQHPAGEAAPGPATGVEAAQVVPEEVNAEPPAANGGPLPEDGA